MIDNYYRSSVQTVVGLEYWKWSRYYQTRRMVLRIVLIVCL